jgi:hypothetical protein
VTTTRVICDRYPPLLHRLLDLGDDSPSDRPGGTPIDYGKYLVDVNGALGMGPDARDWASNATRYNLSFWATRRRRLGRWRSGTPNSGGVAGCGHVAYVDKVNSDGSIIVETST